MKHALLWLLACAICIGFASAGPALDGVDDTPEESHAKACRALYGESIPVDMPNGETACQTKRGRHIKGSRAEIASYLGSRS